MIEQLWRAGIAAGVVVGALSVCEAQEDGSDQQSTSSPVSILEAEHEVVHLMVGAADEEVRSIQETGAVNIEDVRKMLEFFENFVDRCHHAKEESYLFPAIHRQGSSEERDMIRSLRQDHGEGRVRLGDLRGALNRLDRPGNATTAEDVGAALAAYATGLRMHAQKEDERFFPAAMKLIGQAEAAEMVEGFERIEREVLGEGEHEKYHRWAQELAGGHAEH